MIEEREKAIRRIVQIAGEAVRTASPTAGLMEKEGRSNFVTAADLASEKIIMDFIRENYPGDQILSEETVSNIQNPDHSSKDERGKISCYHKTGRYSDNLPYQTPFS